MKKSRLEYSQWHRTSPILCLLSRLDIYPSPSFPKKPIANLSQFWIVLRTASVVLALLCNICSIIPPWRVNRALDYNLGLYIKCLEITFLKKVNLSLF